MTSQSESESESESPSAPLRDRAALLLTKWALHLLARLPLETARGLGRRLGQFNHWLDGRPRRVAERNIRLAYPELDASARAALVKSAMMETGALVSEMGHVWVRPWAFTESLIRSVEGLEYLQEAQEQKRGVIILGPHLGNWEVLGLHLATVGETVALYEPPQIAALGTLIREARERSGSQLVPTTPRGIAAITRSVKRGAISGILPDQVPTDPSGGLNVPFMGVTCATTSLGCSLIRRSGAVALMGVALRVPGGFKIRYVKPDPSIYSEDLAVSLTTMNREVEKLLRGWDAQYQWQYKRFRTRPHEGTDHYLHLMRR
ncbi:lipid A biosynthesis lauroyl acyltransferase [Luminiphilus syltensis NOR5-1B]|uniref:Lipid A biosynthesis lauroyl acyltransferase n=1 Tax=Luminiphilus syltensis NOR5-1B TaxID=565045 RepID=B8KUF5_9GAMM|nr:lysophospholipid acyltransferase family protein [Luminiphilus syltensis]EED36783.1 lipid A biosynthesis lauroyl acyltransferase [Luminiphilus syltensis NOR5-1B]